MDTVQTIRCTWCDKFKSPHAFNLNGTRERGRGDWCRQCGALYDALHELDEQLAALRAQGDAPVDDVLRLVAELDDVRLEYVRAHKGGASLRRFKTLGSALNGLLREAVR